MSNSKRFADFVSDADFDYVGVFAYSPEEGTKAAVLPDQIDEETKLERLRTLRDLADSVSQTSLARFVGKEVDVLVLGQEEDGALFGRSAYQAPDVDGVTFIDEGKVGEVVPIMIEDVLYYEMEGFACAITLLHNLQLLRRSGRLPISSRSSVSCSCRCSSLPA